MDIYTAYLATEVNIIMDSSSSEDFAEAPEHEEAQNNWSDEDIKGRY